MSVCVSIDISFMGLNTTASAQLCNLSVVQSSVGGRFRIAFDFVPSASMIIPVYAVVTHVGSSGHLQVIDTFPVVNVSNEQTYSVSSFNNIPSSYAGETFIIYVGGSEVSGYSIGDVFNAATSVMLKAYATVYAQSSGGGASGGSGGSTSINPLAGFVPNITQTGKTETSITLSSTTNQAATKYTWILQTTDQLFIQDSPSITLSNLACGKSYQLMVVAHDESGNFSQDSPAFTAYTADCPSQTGTSTTPPPTYTPQQPTFPVAAVAIVGVVLLGGTLAFIVGSRR